MSDNKSVKKPNSGQPSPTQGNIKKGFQPSSDSTPKVPSPPKSK